MSFNINKYLGKVVMHCKTSDEAYEFCRYLDSIGRKWCTGQRYVDDVSWDRFGSDTCYEFNAGKYDRAPIYNSLGYTILEWSDFTAKFTKANLRDGIVVELACGDRFLVLGINIINSKGFIRLDDYNNNLEVDRQPYSWNINKVYRSSALSIENIFKDAFLTLIWERTKKPEPIEMTLEEVCKELGKEIKIIK